MFVIFFEQYQVICFFVYLFIFSSFMFVRCMFKTQACIVDSDFWNQTFVIWVGAEIRTSDWLYFVITRSNANQMLEFFTLAQIPKACLWQLDFKIWPQKLVWSSTMKNSSNVKLGSKDLDLCWLLYSAQYKIIVWNSNFP